ncbi:MAG: hypothetical protein A3J07_03780 [Candidatus Doudnabacteria bacterium RIFCSPLOWO2_02_FULL_49_13]|uniref:Addiction module toxin, HicA family n=1 Tax=Candidatus Doudnabacteria bacterium RIFCSPHIGHO2_12_FULL_48_16 TaxID=1817838 RepID=A0A1F5PJB5_9BACT|nr:MAG: hypothetical protein A3B77_02590 [Candidatus Doudnabacteria bacterium RIFCSPHIGHO2_02_FULL_49_24]OGE89595.1 MAG: hypothetical protein A2760_03795 [Candidatus Doudnabacteria bacterium RIFCSPHIGHO2_01_FULL_50_67]OGE90038.1 MAG: hypothetical protein A3E29_02925 [Candidatus Doudnabacteria bacterium RIFCSPHIGHO2_12_FULL_48_16]OGE96611.1 MAG: hypothetical protein A2990_00235 [Candidatus Doudnabacteria bacterium RIFCSPLOWO2_01_FULL_49_40]OGF03181.1 MAG: hypothetical protein A3J07_03780 [Candid
MPKIFSGKEVTKVLCRSFGFSFISQKGSHVKLAKQQDGKTITTIVPMHKELARGTWKGILELAKVSEQEFLDKA